MLESLKWKAWLWKVQMPERFAFWLAWMLPRWLVYYAAIRMWAEVSGSNEYSNTVVTEIRVDDCLKHWNRE